MSNRLLMRKETFERKNKEKTFDFSYVKWNKSQYKYIPLLDIEKEYLEVILLNDHIDGIEILNFANQKLKEWKIPRLEAIKDTLENGFGKYLIFVYGKNLTSNNDDKELFSLSVLTYHNDRAYLYVNIAYPESQTSREKRLDGIIGAVGSNTRHAMISYAFNNLKCNSVTTEVESDKALASLIALGFKET